MSKFRVGAIVPVKTFSRAKTRLNLSEEKTEQICSIMLESVLSAISQSNVMEETVIVSKDEFALNMGKKFGAIQVYDQEELGVNNAVMLGDRYFVKEDFDLTIVFPQDIPLIQPEDIRMLFEMKGSNRCVLVVPSRTFDGTNALLRMPVDVMETHYDEDSYKIHLNTAEKKNATSALILIPRIMLDVDDQADLRLVLTRDLPVSKSLESVFKS
ncbi:MAG: 2-phospho-L-lactate guanylyltransferase [Thaumarchaeota archaeon 13_1_40CM_38_12]|nr:MAG: 2-phospho-L-lactate guanylyltransferase [Thaumarchaeota archaeon 13_1_40CM_38_12]OLD27651.1 MAG: 2-phospho-L-lactate guanylyltransferase [Thaumarchaeota archaeon 13_1_40CM_2_39_7]TLY05466.1 MAG: 2-phospho-L-lactate guanylyltransferase [Nitrososphaerota archaeon]